MSSTESHRRGDAKFLDPYIEAARRQFRAGEIEPAAERLRQRLPSAGAGRRAAVQWPLLAAAASVVFAAVTAVLLLLPGQDGSAFAQAQEWFSSYETLRIETTVEMGQETVSRTDLWVDDADNVRIEAGGVATIVRPDTESIYILLPDGRAIMQSIPPDAAAEASTDWLEQVRDFQGQADLLAESRIIEGIDAAGYELTIGMTTFVLWVDPADGRPLQVESETVDGTTMRHALSFDVSLPPRAFDVPDNVQPLMPHE